MNQQYYLWTRIYGKSEKTTQMEQPGELMFSFLHKTHFQLKRSPLNASSSPLHKLPPQSFLFSPFTASQSSWLALIIFHSTFSPQLAHSVNSQSYYFFSSLLLTHCGCFSGGSLHLLKKLWQNPPKCVFFLLGAGFIQVN